MEVANLLEFNDRQLLHEWLERNHASECVCWVAVYRTKTRPEGVCIPYVDAVEEALCFGWIDSTTKRLEDGRHAQRLSPRRKGSHWTELNKQRCRNLIAQGLMTDAGLQELAKAEKQ